VDIKSDHVGQSVLGARESTGLDSWLPAALTGGHLASARSGAAIYVVDSFSTTPPPRQFDDDDDFTEKKYTCR